MTPLAPVAYLLAFIAIFAQSIPDPTIPQKDDGASYSLSLDAYPSSKSKCTVDHQNNFTTNFSFEESTDNCSTISATYTQEIWTVNELGGILDAFSTLKIYVGSVELFSQHLSLENGRFQKTLQWGPIIHGANVAVMNAASGAATNGTIDGRSFVLKDNKTIEFLDGKDPPVLTFSTDIQPVISSFAKRMATALQLCIVGRTGYNTSMPASVSPIFVRQDGGQDRGHLSSTYTDFDCMACKASVTAWWIAFEAACASATCWFFGLGCAACTAATVIGLPLSIESCVWSFSCCPISCGSGTFPFDPPPCCSLPETCLNEESGLCCARGKQPCAGRTCCSERQSCCGGSCCRENSNCIEGACCSPSETCGAKCCNPDTDNGPRGHSCANAAKSLCCPIGEVEVGNTGKCCPPGSILLGGAKCCPPRSILCRGECCVGTCHPIWRNCQSTITDQECQAMGSAGACATTPRSWSCESCDVLGCCIDLQD